jgi:hypothetical protein
MIANPIAQEKIPKRPTGVGSSGLVRLRRFPIQAYEIDRSIVTVPWEHAEEAYKEYSAQFGTSQSLERLAERQGFGAAEIVTLLVQRIKRLETKQPNDSSSDAPNPGRPGKPTKL